MGCSLRQLAWIRMMSGDEVDRVRASCTLGGGILSANIGDDACLTVRTWASGGSHDSDDYAKAKCSISRQVHVY
ncbi:uncharacterized protein MYCFIDRAFT_176739 [Pseudocercospora fijiensis CIRAD86]|uniref:Uncharacterized protein n=1 Tax=Pseudocercospora fijiensis (strain CIRAD86) TaxID=383855 RepID=M3AVE9_PSEFD|nr:uncharacterized protein MYCFIDRAFT_176739 [Pseudocercospora fijiensis CIRAD86]EME81462.1 hypothetical protein MYCFIDRAFT_176739 [Pseudocercospora fijiensis CIRAD86]